MLSTSAAIVRTLRTPKTTSSSAAPIGPKPASAMGSARTPAPTVSVRVKVKASQNGGRDSSRREIAARRQRSRSRNGTGATPAAETSTPGRAPAPGALDPGPLSMALAHGGIVRPQRGWEPASLDRQAVFLDDPAEDL